MDEVTPPYVNTTNTSAPAPAKPAKNKKKQNPAKILMILVMLLLVVAVAALAYLYNKERNQVKTLTVEVTRLSNPTEAAKQEINALVTKIKTLIDLPANETPTVATVSDVTKLANQPFFKNAQNGDRILIYTDAKKIVLYRPSTNKVVDVSALTINNTPATTTTNTKK